VDEIDAKRRTALGYSTSVEDPRGALALLQAGAQVNVQDVDGETPLLWAVTNDNLPVTKALLAHGADPNGAKREGLSILLCAVGAARPECIRLLLENGADVKARDQEGDSVLWWAKHLGQSEHREAKIRLLRQYGAPEQRLTR